MRVSTSDTTGKRKGSASNDIFEKCRNFTRPSDLQSAGLYMYFEVFGDREGCGAGEVRMGHRKVLMFGSNDYLDLITHPKVKEAAMQAVKKYGSGCSGSRLHLGMGDQVQVIVGPEHPSQGEGSRHAGRQEVRQWLQRFAPSQRHAGCSRKAGSRTRRTRP